MKTAQAQTQRPPYKPDYAEYERLKQDWLRDNPYPTPATYQNAMQQIAGKCGI
jgi:hypothetical protein